MVLYKTKEEEKEKNKLFCENKAQRKYRILKSGIRNPQAWNPESTAWNPESKTLLDYLTWGEKGLGHAILGNFSTDQMIIELTEI